MQIPRALDLPKRVVQQAMDDEVPDLAAGLAYRFLFAVFPFAIFLTALAAFVAQWVGLGDPTNEILAALRDNLPAQVAAQIGPQLETVLGQARPGLLSLGALAALWAATGGVSSLMSAMNKAYDVKETRNFFAKTALAIGLTVLASAGILVAFVTIVGGSVITEQAIRSLGVGPSTWNTIALLRWPLVLVLVAVAVASLFRFGPNVAVSFRWTLVGGAVFAVGWLLVTGVFGLYVANFGSYANTYGALGGVIVLMLWFYLTALLLLIAAEVTSVLAKEREPERVQARKAETEAGHAAKEAAKRAGRRTGVLAGVLAGVGRMVTAVGRGSAQPMAAETGAADEAQPEPGSAGASIATPRPALGHERAEPSRAAESRDAAAEPAPIHRIPRPEPRPRFVAFEPRPSRVFALVVLVFGGIAGALAGLLAGDDEDAATGG